MDFSLKEDFLQFTGYNKAAMHLTQSGANTVIDFGSLDTVTLLNTKVIDPNLLNHIFF